MTFEIYRYDKSHLKDIINLFRDTVHQVNCRDYTLEQLAVWAPQQIDADSWHQSLDSHYSLVAKSYGLVVGFADLDGAYLDRLFVHKDYLRQGIAARLLFGIEAYAKKTGRTELTTHASITAKPFFLRHGYEVDKEQLAERKGVLLRNYSMKKLL